MKRNTPIRLALALAAVLALTAGLGVASGAIPSSSGKIYGCFAKSDGELRVIDKAKQQKCKSTEQALNWNQQGPKGDPGLPGAPGPKGDKGDPGQAGGFPDALPSGKSVRGAYSAFDTKSAPDNFASDSISFGFVLPSAPTAHFVRAGGPADPACPGTASAPQAAPGHLCIYEADTRNAEVFFDDPLTGATGGAVRAFGAEVGVRAGLADSDFGSRGSWAVTAP